MPLRDHFHPPLVDQRAWDGFHTLWASLMVLQLKRVLPARYYAIPHTHLGTQVEIDVATYEGDSANAGAVVHGNGGVAVAAAPVVWAPPNPALTFDVDFAGQDLFEVRVYNEQRGRLVAAVELVSPANKDRPATRQAFAIKCASYLQEGVALVVVDMVTERRDSLHEELMNLLRLEEPGPGPGPLYAVAYRTAKDKEAWRMETWPTSLTIGTPLPTMPLWITADLAIPLQLEETYELTCQTVNIH
jgi:hypothetical protein